MLRLISFQYIFCCLSFVFSWKTCRFRTQTVSCHLRLVAFGWNAKDFAIAFIFFFIFLLLDSVFGWTYKSFYVCFRDCYTGRVRPVPDKLHWTHWKMIVVKSSLNLKFRVREHDMSYVLEQKIMADSSGHTQSRIPYECRIPHLW